MPRTKPSGLTIQDTVVGSGVAAERGSTVSIHYRLFLNRGDLVQDTRSSGAPYQIQLGRRHVIAGLERGVIGMRVGGQRELVVSPHLAYRDEGVAGIIPANAVLRFEIELLNVSNDNDRNA